MFGIHTKFANCNDCYFTVLGRSTLAIISKSEGPIMFVNKDVDGVNFPEEIAVKDYAENEGLLSELLRLGVIDEPRATVPAGYASLSICKFNYDKAMSL